MAVAKHPQTQLEQPKMTPSMELFLPSTRIIRDNIWVFFVLLVIPFLLLNSIFVFRIGIKSATVNGVTTASVQPAFWLMILISGIYSLLTYAPLIYGYNKAAKGDELEIKDVFVNGLKYFWRLVGLSIITGLLVLGGLVLFIVPGVIMLRRYFLAPYYVVDRNMGISKAMQNSADESKQFSGSVYGVFGAYILISFVTWIPFIGTYASSVMQLLYGVAPALRYREIKKAYVKEA